MTKKKRDEVRSDMKRLLANLDAGWVTEASESLGAYLLELLETETFRKRSRILAWTSFFAGEVDLSPVVTKILTEKKVYLPRSLPDMSMSYVSIGKNWVDEMQPGEHGIPEPCDEAGELYEPDSMAHESIVLVPGVAFDLIGNRIGRGKGYYDRFLGHSSGEHLLTVGICWNLQIVDSIPIEAHDVPMDFICHEEGYLRTSLDSAEEFLS